MELTAACVLDVVRVDKDPEVLEGGGSMAVEAWLAVAVEWGSEVFLTFACC
jgi:hypothetical protein